MKRFYKAVSTAERSVLLDGKTLKTPRGAVLVLPTGTEHQAGTEHVSEGAVHGRLIREPRGSNGFGYDPIFVPDGDHRTTAELSPDEKDAISHRSRALRGLLPAIAAGLSA